MDVLSSLLSGLSLAEKKVDYLTRVKPALSSLTRADIAAGLSSLDLIVLFDCLNTDDQRQIETTCDVLRYLLEFLDPVHVLTRYGELMRLGLDHPDERVGLLVMHQLQRLAVDDDLAALVGQHAIFLHVVGKLKAELVIATEVIKFLVQMAETRVGLQLIAKESTIIALQSLCSVNETVKLRVLEAAVKISQISQEHLDVVCSSGLLGQLTSLLDTTDILTRLNAVELLTALAVTHQGLRYLDSNGVLGKMETLLIASPNEPFAAELFPGMIKFFGNLAHLRPRQIIAQYPAFGKALLDMADSNDRTQAAIAFETLGYIGESLEGKTALAELGNRFTHILTQLGQLVRDGPTETRIHGLNALASLLRLDKENQAAEFVSLTECWYRRVLGPLQPLALLAGMVKLPFPDLRLAAYLVLNNISQQSWGRTEILSCPGFTEFLLDRETERDKAGKEARYLLLVSLAANGPEVVELVGKELDFLLREYVRLGPFYVEAQSQVAFESGS